MVKPNYAYEKRQKELAKKKKKQTNVYKKLSPMLTQRQISLLRPTAMIRRKTSNKRHLAQFITTNTPCI